jgi:AraC family transcriptional regulator
MNPPKYSPLSDEFTWIGKIAATGENMPRPDTCAHAPSALLADITQGRRLWRHQAQGFGAQLVTHTPALDMPRHAHRCANITIVLAGSFEEEIDGHHYDCGPLCVVVKPAGTVHATRAGTAGTRSLVVDVQGGLEDELRRRVGLFDECRWFHEPCGLAPSVLGLCCELFQRGSLTDGAGSAWFSRISKAALRAPRPKRGPGLGMHVRRGLQIIQRESAVSTADLSIRLGLHPVYVARLFRERLGCSPGWLRQTLRLGAALEQIVATRQSLARVASEAGFADQSHLARQVKRYAGIPPAALRRLASGDPRQRPAADHEK